MAAKVSYDTIAACKMGSEDALRDIIKHYEPLIVEAAKRTRVLSNGKTEEYVDEDIKSYIESELAMKILLKYDLTKKPRKKRSTQSPDSTPGCGITA